MISRRGVLLGGAAAAVAAAAPLPALGDGMTSTVTLGTDWTQSTPDQIVRDIEAMMKIVAEATQIPQRYLFPAETFARLQMDHTDENRRIEDQRRREESRGGGYTGDMCNGCGNFRMRRSGTCLACDACGQTTGCS